MPVLGPYPYFIPPGMPYTPPGIYPATVPWQPPPSDIFIGDPPLGWSNVTITLNSSFNN